MFECKRRRWWRWQRLWQWLWQWLWRWPNLLARAFRDIVAFRREGIVESDTRGRRRRWRFDRAHGPGLGNANAARARSSGW